MNIHDQSLETLKKGYLDDHAQNQYRCLFCHMTFDKDEIFKEGDRFFTAAHQIKAHLLQAHGTSLTYLLALDKKMTGLTDHQKSMMKLSASGMQDKEIAETLLIAPSTVRHMRFALKEKAKQAKLFLAAYECTFDTEESYVPIHATATMVDDRYRTTDAEQEKILKNMFHSLNPPVLKQFSPKEKKKIIILTHIAKSFTRGQIYSEKELNEILKPIYDDYVTLRRYLIEYGYMDRSKDGSKYWLKDTPKV